MDSWVYTCMDIGTLIRSRSIYRQRETDTAMKIERIRLFREEGQDFFIDNVYIGDTLPQCEYQPTPGHGIGPGDGL